MSRFVPQPIVSILVALATIGALLVGCSEARPTDGFPVDGTALVTPSPTMTPTMSPTAALSPTGAESTPTATPAQGRTETWIQPPSEHNEAFLFNYPAGWFVKGEPPPAGYIGFTLSITSWDRTLASPSAGPNIPEGEVKANLVVVPVGEVPCIPSDGQPAPFGDLPGRERVRNAPFTEPPEQNLSRIVEIGASTGSFEYCLTAFFTLDSPDESGIRLIIDSFEVDQK